MSSPDLLFRPVSIPDGAPIAAIYTHHVLYGTASYDIEGPSVSEVEEKIGRITSAGWPFLVVELEGALAGYAYATQFRDRAAYAFACEDSIYVHPHHVGKGIGTGLLRRLCEQAEAFGFRQIIAVVGGAEEASIRLHEACGFAQAGRLRAVGWKKQQWLDTVYMQRALGGGSAEPPRS
jgi:phosphinothricin acetyltransferase